MELLHNYLVMNLNVGWKKKTPTLINDGIKKANDFYSYMQCLKKINLRLLSYIILNLYSENCPLKPWFCSTLGSLFIFSLEKEESSFYILMNDIMFFCSPCFPIHQL